jgi:hypothetical protein
MCTVVVKMYRVTGLEQWYNVYRNGIGVQVYRYSGTGVE